MDALKELELFEAFAGLQPEARSLLAQGLVQKNFARHAAVLHKGQPVSGAYMVLSGRLRIFTITPSGTEATLYFVDPGETCVLIQRPALSLMGAG